MPATPSPVLPDYGGACIDSVAGALLAREARSWLPESVLGATQIVLLVLDGLGWDQLQERLTLAPTLAGMTGGPITSVAPSTTATALTSIATGLPPSRHGVVGYRVRVRPAGADGDEVLNVLRWRAGSNDARETVPPTDFQRTAAFGGAPVPAVTRAEFDGSGFTLAHLAGARFVGWRLASSVAVEVRAALAEGAPFVYAYYDGIDRVAHAHGLGAHYEAEVTAADRVVADVLDALPAGAALVVTADHGQVEVGKSVVHLDPDILAACSLLSGEGRFRWLHAIGDADELAAEVARQYGDVAWIATRDTLVADGWFGGPLTPAAAERMGDVAIVPHAPVAFVDPADVGELFLVSRHGSLTSAEMYVPLLVSALR